MPFLGGNSTASRQHYNSDSRFEHENCSYAPSERRKSHSNRTVINGPAHRKCARRKALALRELRRSNVNYRFLFKGTSLFWRTTIMSLALHTPSSTAKS